MQIFLTKRIKVPLPHYQDKHIIKFLSDKIAKLFRWLELVELAWIVYGAFRDAVIDRYIPQISEMSL